MNEELIGAPPAASRVLVLVFTDLAGSAGLKTEKGDEAAATLIARHRKHVKEQSRAAGGRIIDWAGDGCFLTFETPSAAVRFALGLQQQHEKQDDLPRAYVGIHMGEVVERTDPDNKNGPPRIEGLAVDTAARIQSLAYPGQILMSGAVFNSARQRINSKSYASPILWQAHGAYHFKDFDDFLQIGEVGFEGSSPFVPPSGAKRVQRAVTRLEEEILGWRPSRGVSLPGRENWRMVSHLGTGGFGEIWLAADASTGERHVFKFCFEPDRLKGLKREVVLLRVLKEVLGDREDIARVYSWELDSQPYFIETEYTGGGDLKTWAAGKGGIDKIPIEIRLDLVAQAADALGAAHGAGILHKDIKPANILISQPEDDAAPKAVLTDFGIGLLTAPDVLKEKNITAMGLTETLVAGRSSSGSGTALYMAPELLEGKLPTQQSDIYSLGVLLYQMVAGDLSRALAPGWEQDVTDDLLKEDIAACVRGVPESRLSNAGDLAQRLRSLNERKSLRKAQYLEEKEREKIARRRQRTRKISGYAALIAVVVAALIWNVYSHRPEIAPASVEEMAFPLPEKPSIAVMPFTNLSGDPAQEYLSDGITENLISVLSALPNLFVIASNSSFAYKGKAVKVQQVAEDLGVHYVLEGSVASSDGHVRVTAQLIDALEGYHIWSDRYDWELKDLFSLQDELVRKVLTGIGLELIFGEDALPGEFPQNIQVWIKFLQGVKYLRGFNIDDNNRARLIAEECIALEPDYWGGYTLYGSVHMMDYWLGYSKSPEESVDTAIQFMKKALDVADTAKGQVYPILGYLYALKKDYGKAIELGEKGISLVPNGANAYAWLALSLKLAGNAQEAIPHFEKALRLNPLPPAFYFLNLGEAYGQLGRHDEAIGMYRKTIALTPDNIFAHVNMAVSCVRTGKEEEAREAAKEVLRINPKFSVRHYMKIVPINDPDARHRYSQVLRQAGLPE